MPCSRVARASRHERHRRGADQRRLGVPRSRRGRRRRSPRGPISTTWWRVPSARRPAAVSRARRSAGRWKATENVRSSWSVASLGERGDEARVEAAREVGADRHVGAQAQADACRAVSSSRRDAPRAVARRCARRASGRAAPTRCARSTIAPSLHTSRPPGGSCATPAKRCAAARGPQSVKTSSMPARSGSARPRRRRTAPWPPSRRRCRRRAAPPSAAGARRSGRAPASAGAGRAATRRSRTGR